MTNDSLIAQQFDKLATEWEEQIFELGPTSKMNASLDVPAYAKLKNLGQPAVPLIFARWKLEEEQGRVEPPWWRLLEAITDRKMMTKEERLNGIPSELIESGALDAADVDAPDEQKKRWFKWWKTKGAK